MLGIGELLGSWGHRRGGRRGGSRSPSPGRPWSRLRCMFRAGRSSPILMICTNNRSRISSTTIWFWRFSLAGVAMRPRRMGSMPPGGKRSKAGERVRLSVRAQTGVRHKSKVESGGLQKRAGHMQILVPRGPRGKVLTGAPRSQGIMLSRCSRLGCSLQPLASWVTESHNTQEGASSP